MKINKKNIICEKCGQGNIKIIEGYNSYLIPLLSGLTGAIIMQTVVLIFFNTNGAMFEVYHYLIILYILIDKMVFIKTRNFMIKRGYYIKGYYCSNCNFETEVNIKNKKPKDVISNFLFFVYLYLIFFLITGLIIKYILNTK